MKKTWMWAFVVAAVLVATAWASTKMRDLIITSSTIDSSPVGATTPSTGNFTTLKLNGSGPAGHTLVGNGTSYVDSFGAVLVSSVDSTTLTGDVSSTTLYAIPSGQAGNYMVTCYAVLTNLEGNNSPIVPQCNLNWVDEDTGATEPVYPNPTTTPLVITQAGGSGSGIPGATGIPGLTVPSNSGSVIVRAAASSNLSYSLTGYDTGTGGTGNMQYAVHLRVYYLGQ